MNFITTQFVVFFLLVLCLGTWLRHVSLRGYKGFLLLVSLVFYALAGPRFLLLLGVVALLGWGTVRLMSRPQATARMRFWLITGDVAAHVLLLAFFKYYEFLFETVMNLGDLFQWELSALFSAEIADMAFPVGLSFYSFQSLSYAIDHYRNRELSARSFPEVLGYVSFFPTVMSGPILREHDFFPQLEKPEKDQTAFVEGMGMILSGLFKKVILATYIAQHLVDPVYGNPGDYSWYVVLAAVYGYSIQIFCDFSGYTDLAMGVGRLMGFRLPQNFRSPYCALNLQDFWRRWHISLSQWLRDYLYISMGGNRRGNCYVNIIMTMVIGGLWHGSGLNFLIWGFFHGAGQAVARAWRQLLQVLNTAPAEGARKWVGMALAWLLTFHFVALLWIFFRTDSFESAWTVITRVLSGEVLGDAVSHRALVAILVGFTLQWAGAPLFRAYVSIQQRMPWVAQVLCVVFLAESILMMGPEGMLPFIYFSF